MDSKELVVLDKQFEGQHNMWHSIHNKIKSDFKERMSEPTDPDLVKEVDTWDTVSHGHCIIWLSDHFPESGFDDKQWFGVGPPGAEVVVCSGQLKIIDNMIKRTIPGTGRHKVRYLRGTDKPVDIGHNYISAESEAIKKAASRVGFAPDVLILDNRPPYSKLKSMEKLLESDHLTRQQKEQYQGYIDDVTQDRADSLLNFLTQQVAKGVSFPVGPDN